MITTNATTHYIAKINPDDIPLWRTQHTLRLKLLDCHGIHGTDAETILIMWEQGQRNSDSERAFLSLGEPPTWLTNLTTDGQP